MNEQDVEKEIQEKGLTAPRLTPEHIDSVIKSAEYVVMSNKTTICTLELINGFRVVGASHCVSVENFDKEIGEKIAYKNARDEIWQLQGYLLQQAMYEGKHKVEL